MLWVGTSAMAAVDASVFESKIGYTISGYAGTSAVTDLPVLVRLSADSPKGFSFARCAQDSIRFADADGNLIPHEIDTWDSTGESLIWVKIPSVSGQSTSFTMYYGGLGKKPEALAPTDVWSNYAAVFHGGAKGYANAVGNAVVGSAGSEKVTVQKAACKVGGGINKQQCNYAPFNFTNPVKAGALASAKNMTLSGWFAPSGFKNDSNNLNTGILACSRNAWADAGNPNGFALMCEAGTWLSLSVGEGHNPTSKPSSQPAFAWARYAWNHYAFTYQTDDGSETYATYCNGGLCSTGVTVNKLDDSGSNAFWSFGGLANAAKVDNFRGDMDELRVFNGAASADYVAAEYATVGASDFLTTSGVEVLQTLPAARYAKRIDFALSEVAKTALAGKGTQTVPVAVRLSSEIQGFSYDDFNAGHTDLLFGTEQDGVIDSVYSHEIESWDPSGESVVWVLVPVNAEGTSFSLFYGNDARDYNDPSSVWAGYVGVWHMSENGGEAIDSTGHGLVGVPTKGASGTDAMIAEMIATDGVIGRGRVNQTSAGSKRVAMVMPNYDSYVTDQAKFTVSGWFLSTSTSGYPRPLSHKKAYNDTTGWEIQMNQNTAVQGSGRGSSDAGVNFATPDVTAGWNHFAFAFDNTTFRAVINGAQSASGTIAAVKQRSEDWAVGNNLNVSEQGWCGSYDEVRLYDGALSNDYLAFECAAMQADFLTAGAATVIDADAPVFQAPTAVVDEDGTVTVNVEAKGGKGALALSYGDDSNVTQLGSLPSVFPKTYTDHPAVPAGAIWEVTAIGTSPSGSVLRKTMDGGVMNARVTVVKTADAAEDGLVHGVFTLSRPASATSLPLTVNLGWTEGSAVAGTDYADDLPTQVTIPEGETSVAVEVTPLFNAGSSASPTVVLTVLEGPYICGETAQLSIANLELDSAWNTWIAPTGSDGLATTAANWSLGVPTADQKIRFDGRFSNENCTWDAADNELAQRVAAWDQRADYMGTVTLATTFAADKFPKLEVTGACDVLGGTLTHPLSLNRDSQSFDFSLADMRARAQYRLAIESGTFTLGAQAKIDLIAKGMSAKRISGNVKVMNAAHGGSYGNQSCYGNVKYPTDIGMPGNAGTDSANKTSAGGGALKLKVAGACVINGLVTVDGEKSSGSLAASAAGSVLIEAERVTGSGEVHADAVYCGNNSYNNGAAGRIAVITRDPVDVNAPLLSASGTGSGKYAASGTVYVKDDTMTHGVLYVRNVLNTASGNQTPGRGTYVTNEEGVDWTFDGIVLGGNVNLIVPEGTTLALPNGAASVTTSDTARYASFSPKGGTVDFGTAKTQVLSGAYNFAPMKPFAFAEGTDVELKNGVNLGLCGYYDQSATPEAADTIVCTVNGNLTVDADAALNVTKAGTQVDSNRVWENYGIGTHGGRRSNTMLTYDSVFNPSLPSICQSNSYGNMKAGGALTLTVTGTLTMNGTADGTGIDSQSGGYNLAAGGAYNITAGSLVGSGTFTVRGYRGGQAGGRIAIKLTDKDADFSSFTGKILAHTAAGSTSSSAGTIYLQSGNEPAKGGTLYIDNGSGAVTGISTPICATGAGCDQVLDFCRTKLVIRNGGYAQVTGGVDGAFKMSSLTVESSGGKLDLNGNVFTVKSAKLGDMKLSPGTYTSESDGLADYLVDTATDSTGKLVVAGNGLTLIVR